MAKIAGERSAPIPTTPASGASTRPTGSTVKVQVEGKAVGDWDEEEVTDEAKAKAAGLIPPTGSAHFDQAQDRTNLTNLQTDFERENAIDPISGMRGTGVTFDQAKSHTSAAGPGTYSDDRGRQPMPDPLTVGDMQEKDTLSKYDGAKGDKDKYKDGWVPGRVLGSKAILDKLVADKKLELGIPPGMQYMPDEWTYKTA